MKVLMLSWEYPPRIVGGISRVVYDLAHHISQNHEVHVITCWETGNEQFEKDEKVFVHRVQTCTVNTVNFVDWVLQLNFAMVECAIRLIHSNGNFDIVHAHDWLVAFSANTIKGAYQIPVIATMHATEHGRNWGLHNDTQRYINNVEAWFTALSDRIIVNSEYMKNEVMEIFSLPQEKLKVIPNGIGIDKFEGVKKDLVFRRTFALDSEKIVFFVGRIVNEKGVHVLIDAVPKVLSFCPETKFIIAGKGPQLDYLKWKVWNLGISDKVYFTGYVNDENLNKLYKCVDVAVFPSLYEPFGIVVLESMVARVPVVVSDTGGLGGIVEHGVDGMKAYTGNANSLADCIIDVLVNEQKAQGIVENAFEKVSTSYHWEKITQMTMEVYDEVKTKERWKNGDEK
jgi:glycogen synthase